MPTDQAVSLNSESRISYKNERKYGPDGCHGVQP